MSRALLAFVLLAALLAGCGAPADASRVTSAAPPAAVGNYLTGVPALNQDGTLNVVIEIPAGTTAKWRVSESGDAIYWVQRNGELRRVGYLPYPANYGMVPRTIRGDAEGGDGWPLDVLVLDAALARGTIVQAKVIGVLRMTEGGDRDDKLLTVIPGTGLGEVDDLEELEARFPGVAQILATWFANYKRNDEIEIEGFGDVKQAREVLQRASAAFEATRATGG